MAGTRELADRALAEKSVAFVMLTVQSVLMVVVLDTPHLSAALGGAVCEPEVRGRLRAQLIGLIETLVCVARER